MRDMNYCDCAADFGVLDSTWFLPTAFKPIKGECESLFFFSGRQTLLLPTLRHVCVCVPACRTFQVSMVLSALQAGNKGTQACITAESAVSGIIADLDTTIMFASAGTLNPENEESFADHR